MTRIRYVDEAKRFYSAKAKLLPHVQSVITEYAAAGFLLNSRSVAYRLEGRGLIVKTDKAFQQVEDVVSAGRDMGLIDWDQVALDAGRALHELTTWKSVKARLSAAADNFLLDKWDNQHRRVEVMTEKKGLRGILDPVADEYEVPVCATAGYNGKGDVRAAALRIMRRTPEGRLLLAIHRQTGDGTIRSTDGYEWGPDGDSSEQDQRTVVLFVGDHDPSGIDLERDIEAKLDLYGAAGMYELVRVAVTCDETCLREESSLHSNPAKESDMRWNGYCAGHGTDQSWEVESLEPAVLADRVRGAIQYEMDLDRWDEDVAAQESDQGLIRELADLCSDPVAE